MDEPFTRLARRVGQDDQLSAIARLTFAALDCFLDKRTGHCAPSFDRLAGWIGRDRRTVRRAIQQLERAGYIAVNRSTGRRNSYELLPIEASEPVTFDRGTGDKNVPSTGDIFDRGTGDKNVPGLGDSDHLQVLRTRRKERGAPPTRQSDLFEGEFRKWFTAALAYHLEAAGLGELAAWFPPIAADFWLFQSWLRSTDPETALAWARALAAIAATPAEVLEAFEWATAAPAVDRAGRKVFSRPDHLGRIVFRIQAQRKQNSPSPSPSPRSTAEADTDAARPGWHELGAALRGWVKSERQRRP